MKHPYWCYYNKNFEWPENHLIKANISQTREVFSKLNFNESETNDLIESGFITLDSYPDLIIDRYYGGALASSDFSTRILSHHFKDWLNSNIYKRSLGNEVTSLNQLHREIEKLGKIYPNKELLFRGQTKHRALNRKVSNPNWSSDQLGEVSFIPSLWRNLLNKAPYSYHQFQKLSLLDWSRIIYSQFDIAEIDRRIAARKESGEYFFTMSDMEDCEDPLISSFGTCRLDLAMQDSHTEDLLNTLLQHYGLYSPYLDLTTDLKTALYFATHKYSHNTITGQSEYQFVNTNHGESYLYILLKNKNEMHTYSHHRVLKDLAPLRPLRQSCVVCRSDTFSLNLGALYTVAAFKLNFSVDPKDLPTTNYLMPTRHEDNFLSALKETCLLPQYVSEFL